MGDSTYRKHPMQLSDSTSNPRPKRRKYESKQRETLVQLLDQLEKSAKAAVFILDNYGLEGRFGDLRDEVKHIIPSAIRSVRNGDSYSPPFLKYFSSPLALPTESDYHGLNEAGKIHLQVAIETINVVFRSIALVYSSLMDAANAYPPPLDYAYHSVWSEWQENDAAILCLRPTDKQGLSLTVLHDVFRQFQVQARTSISNETYGVHAMQSALRLCEQMGDAFSEEEAPSRTMAFDSCVSSLFSKYHVPHEMQTSSNDNPGFLNDSYSINGILCIIREDKKEPGDGGDAYMQIARDFQLYTSHLLKKQDPILEDGAPTFLLCISGPTLSIAGGYYDGESHIVEPLAEPCLMLPDQLGHRQKVLANQLLALKMAVDGLPTLLRKPHQPLVAGVPRIYSTFSLLSDEKPEKEPKLTFRKRIPHEIPRSFLFLASVGNSDTLWFVKLTNSEYGITVHQTLAANGLAPQLYGFKHLKGGWVTLYNFACNLRGPLARRDKDAIWRALDRVLTVLEGDMFVHGDLRSNHVMLKVEEKGRLQFSPSGQDINMRIVDFDLAGGSGQVYYPLHCDVSILLSRPGGPGTPIVVGHDRTVVNTWWPSFS